MSIGSYIVIGWIACFVLAILLYPEDKRDLSIGVLLVIAPLAFLLMLIYRVTVGLSNAMDPEHKEMIKRQEEGALRWKFLLLTRKLRMHDMPISPYSVHAFRYPNRRGPNRRGLKRK